MAFTVSLGLCTDNSSAAGFSRRPEFSAAGDVIDKAAAAAAVGTWRCRHVGRFVVLRPSRPPFLQARFGRPIPREAARSNFGIKTDSTDFLLSTQVFDRKRRWIKIEIKFHQSGRVSHQDKCPTHLVETLWVGDGCRAAT